MSELSHESIDCRVFNKSDDAYKHGKGGIYYRYDDHGELRFPEDVTSVVILMPVSWGQVKSEQYDELDADVRDHAVSISWDTNHRLNFDKKHSWALSGTHDKPTLSPSLNWVGVWHGFLRDGRLESC